MNPLSFHQEAVVRETAKAGTPRSSLTPRDLWAKPKHSVARLNGVKDVNGQNKGAAYIQSHGVFPFDHQI